ncbi:hypothetical protein L195_g052776 [Trifolium pratense]|uniref:Uncharacterized protein n=1 Tax=Trifolium pratense TaxID=57577 RepID=A0A2K3K6Y7_TRIPR|nr:hypothetical protein L195_g052776 [Trifolium pratense]
MTASRFNHHLKLFNTITNQTPFLIGVKLLFFPRIWN